MARACILVDDLVLRLAALAGTPTGGSEAWSYGSCN